jgi:hypothetical protein
MQTKMDDAMYWQLIDASWKAAGGYTRERKSLAQGKLSEEKAYDLQDALDEVIPALSEKLERLTKEDLLAFDRILEKKLYDIDREEIQAETDGSDDGFLYARGFIVAMGKEYYEAVYADPSKALMDFECEEMCYLSFHIYEEKFGEMPDSGISRESGTNDSGW